MLARRAIVACLFLAATAVSAGAQTAKPAASGGGDPVVARINGELIHRSDVQIAYAALPTETKQRFTLEQAYPRVIDEMVSMIVVEQAAKKARLDSDPVVRKRISLAQAQILQDAYFNTILTHDVTKDKLQAAYAQYAKEMCIRDRDAAEALRLTAQDLLRLNVIDAIVPEPMGGAHRAHEAAINAVGDAIERALQPLLRIDGPALRAQRRSKFLQMGSSGL